MPSEIMPDYAGALKRGQLFEVVDSAIIDYVIVVIIAVAAVDVFVVIF